MFKGAAAAQNHDGLTLSWPTFQVPSLPDDILISFAVQLWCCPADHCREQLKVARSCSLFHTARGSCLLELSSPVTNPEPGLVLGWQCWVWRACVQCQCPLGTADGIIGAL